MHIGERQFCSLLSIPLCLLFRTWHCFMGSALVEGHCNTMFFDEFISGNGQQVVGLLFTGLITEYVLAYLHDLPIIRVNDGLHSLSAGLISSIPRLLLTSVQTASYKFVYQTMYGSTQLDGLVSPLEWCLTFLGVDLGYYWFHRAAHEVNILWAAHQVHHSSEDYNITTSFRQSVVQQFISWVFYIPLAFVGIHPSTLKDQLWLSCFYQIWTHTEVVHHLGLLGYIFVTPSHHRVHHGRNPYCIDKNYGGILIIWDRMFGTFAEEKEETPVFGLVVDRVSSWNPIRTQMSHYIGLMQTIHSTPGISNKLSVLFKGPSWSPGKPRLGDGTYEEVQYPVVKYDRTLPFPAQLYITGHFILVLLCYYEHLAISSSASLAQTVGVILYLLLALTTFGALFDHKWYGPLMEATRCILYLVMDSFTNNKGDRTPEDYEYGFVYSIFVLSSTLWFLVAMTRTDWTGNRLPLNEHKGNTYQIQDIDHNDNCFQESLTATVGIINSRPTR